MSRELKGALFIFAIVCLAYIIPYTLLTNIHSWSGSFLFWIILTIIVIAANYFIIKDWGKTE